MRIAIGSDHRGWQVKTRLIKVLQDAGHEMVDLGTNSSDSVDYPDIAAAVSSRVSEGAVERGILICGTGIGMSISANKFPGVRAATCQDAFVAEMSRRHNDVNVLCLGGDLLGERLVDDLVGIWLKTEFEGGRHGRRIDKIEQLER
ncbi:MAG: ribose 5-phosphate isomerase B [Planctomycetaceae bacterium]|nr:ribose 5-phosphate isomerase B [Planctomycetaceae bacterium]